MNAIPAPILIDPRPCSLCGLTIDRHDHVDADEGPEFFCADLSPDEMTLEDLERRAELRRQEDIAAILERWEVLPPPERPAPARAAPYRTPASTVDAFRYVLALDNPAYLKAWLLDHPRDAPTLLKLVDGM